MRDGDASSEGPGGARGGGIAREGRHDALAQGGAEGKEIENQFMRDREKEKVDEAEPKTALRDDRAVTDPIWHRQKLHLEGSHRL